MAVGVPALRLEEGSHSLPHPASARPAKNFGEFNIIGVHSLHPLL